MKKRMILALMLIGVLAFGAGLGTYAWFTSQATSSGNVFQTGTLIIGNDEVVENILSVQNIYPGWTSGTKTVNIKNNGTLEFKYRMSVEALTNNILYDGDTPLQVKVNGGNFININGLGFVELGNIEAGDTGIFTIEFMLPTDANNDYQGKEANFTFIFDATQVNNANWEK